MEKIEKKEIELLLLKETEKIFHQIDPAAAVIFSKHLKSHCKDLAKKFLKTQRKFQKQMEAIASGVESLKTENNVKVDVKKQVQEELKIKKVPLTSQSKNPLKEIAAPVNKLPSKSPRKGNNLINAASVQKKVKANLVKSVIKSAKK